MTRTAVSNDPADSAEDTRTTSTEQVTDSDAVVVGGNLGAFAVNEPATPEPVASIGRIVHFTDGRGCLAALVIGVDEHNPASNVVALQVFAPGSPGQQFYGCGHEDAPADPYRFESYGKWHWPERA